MGDGGQRWHSLRPDGPPLMRRRYGCATSDPPVEPRGMCSMPCRRRCTPSWDAANGGSPTNYTPVCNVATACRVPLREKTQTLKLRRNGVRNGTCRGSGRRGAMRPLAPPLADGRDGQGDQ